MSERDPRVIASSLAIPPAMAPQRGVVYAPATPRLRPDDAALVDVTSLALYPATPTALPKWGDRSGVVVLNGEYGGLLVTQTVTPARPQAGVVGRPLWSLAGSQQWGWKTSRAWGTAVLEFYEWRKDEDPKGQLDEILKWTVGFAQPTVDVTATVSVPTGTAFQQITGDKGDHAQIALDATNQFTTLRYLSGAVGSHCYINTADPVGSTGVQLSVGQSFGPWYGPVAYQFDDDTSVLEVIEALT